MDRLESGGLQWTPTALCEPPGGVLPAEGGEEALEDAHGVLQRGLLVVGDAAFVGRRIWRPFRVVDIHFLDQLTGGEREND